MDWGNWGEKDRESMLRETYKGLFILHIRTIHFAVHVGEEWMKVFTTFPIGIRKNTIQQY